MENAYGIGVKNRYELFYDEDVDPLEIIRLKEEEKEKRKSDKAHCKEKTKISRTGKPVTSSGLPKKTKEIPALNTTKSNESTDIANKSRIRPFSDRTSKNVRNFEETKEMEGRKNFRNRDEHQLLNNDIREREGEIRRGRGGFRGRGRSRGRGGFFNNFEGRPRREFDRHSGSDKVGLRAVEKRDGAGANNWGDIKSEVSRRKEAEPATWMDEQQLDASCDKQNESTWKDSLQDSEIQNSGKEELTSEKCDNAVAENMESKENEPISEERPDENVREMTLDEWKREQEAKRAVPKYNLRKPGEGEDNNQWKKLYMLKKKAAADDDDEEEEEEEEDEDVDDDEYARRGRHRQLVDIQINFNDSRRGRGRGRGVRGGIGPRSGGSSGSKDTHREERSAVGSSAGSRGFGRGSLKTRSGQQSAPRVDDWNDFPSLVTA